jgi:phage terminase small subunit
MINDKQKSFCHSLLKHKFNQTKAYREAYPDCKSDNAARAAAPRLLANVSVQEYLSTLTEKLEKEELITEKEIIEDLKTLKDRCMQKEPVVEWDKDSKEYVNSGEWQFKENGANKALELLGKYRGMFTDKIKHTGEVRNVLTFGEAADES